MCHEVHGTYCMSCIVPAVSTCLAPWPAPSMRHGARCMAPSMSHEAAHVDPYNHGRCMRRSPRVLPAPPPIIIVTLTLYPSTTVATFCSSYKECCIFLGKEQQCPHHPMPWRDAPGLAAHTGHNRTLPSAAHSHSHKRSRTQRNCRRACLRERCVHGWTQGTAPSTCPHAYGLLLKRWQLHVRAQLLQILVQVS